MAAGAVVNDAAVSVISVATVAVVKALFSSPVQSTGRAIVVTLSSALPLPFPSRHF